MRLRGALVANACRLRPLAFGIWPAIQGFSSARWLVPAGNQHAGRAERFLLAFGLAASIFPSCVKCSDDEDDGFGPMIRSEQFDWLSHEAELLVESQLQQLRDDVAEAEMKMQEEVLVAESAPQRPGSVPEAEIDESALTRKISHYLPPRTSCLLFKISKLGPPCRCRARYLRWSHV